MTYEEALDWLIHKISIDVQNSRDIPKDIECLEMCEKALEKQIPKKPKLYEYTEKPFPECCPCCGDLWNYNEYGDGMKFCWDCGQAIDWSDEE